MKTKVVQKYPETTSVEDRSMYNVIGWMIGLGITLLIIGLAIHSKTTMGFGGCLALATIGVRAAR